MKKTQSIVRTVKKDSMYAVRGIQIKYRPITEFSLSSLYYLTGKPSCANMEAL